MRTNNVYAPTAHLYGHIDPETGSILGVVSVVSKKVESLVVPSNFYKQKRVSNAVGIFYERYVAYILGGSRSSNASAKSPDVQLESSDLAHSLLFEVKAGHRTNGIVLKKQQLETFGKLSNCSYAVVFHQSKEIQHRWESSKNAKRTIRQELERDFSSLFIVPPHLLIEYYRQFKDREQPMPHYRGGDETYVSMKESHMKRLYDEYDGPIEKVSHGRFHIISGDLEFDTSRETPPFLFRKK